MAQYTAVDSFRYMTPAARRRQPSAIRKLGPLMTLPGMISLGGGNPNAQMFPVTGLSFTLRSGEKVELSPAELEEALQYSPTPGLACLLSQLRLLQKREHIFAGDPRPDSAWGISVTTGSQDGLTRVFDMLIQEGDTVLVEDPAYPGALGYLRPLGCQLVGIPTDGDGLIPSALHEVLRTPRLRRPRILYLVPAGQNPSGSTLTLSRKREIYKLCCEFDLIILEDDPYRWLEYGLAPAPPVGSEHLFSVPKNESLFSMDRQGRVIRFDSLSKVLSSGLRIGFVTGPTGFLRQMDYGTQSSSLHTSGVSQMIATKLFLLWGEVGWQEHCRTVALFYARRRDAFMALCDKYLKGLAEWSTPSAGMFVWLRLLHVKDSQHLIEQKAVNAKVLMVHGSCFSPNSDVSSYVRASFSLASDSQMETALQRFVELLKGEAQQGAQSNEAKSTPRSAL